MKVSESTKKAYETSGEKKLNIVLPDLGLSVPMEKMHSQSMSLVEMLLCGDEVEFVGCIPSKFEIIFDGINQDIKGQKIEVTIRANDTEEIPLFKGIIESAQKQTNKNRKKIVAFDELYTKGDIDLADWYNSLLFPISLKVFRQFLFEHIGIEQEEIDLPNDMVVISKQYEPTQLRAISVIKAICQLNGAFGIINRYGKFEYRILKQTKEISGAYPGITLFPPFYPGVGIDDDGSKLVESNVSFYKKVDYEEYSVKPVEKVTIRQSDSEVGVTFGEGTNNYIVQGNMFTVGLSEDVLLGIAQNIHANISGIEFIPFTSDNSGYPFIEVGLDAVSYYTYNFEASEKARSADVYSKKTFYVFKRTLSGIQALKDSYGAEGKEYQSEFITDLGTQIEQIKNNINNEVKKQISELEKVIEDKMYSKEEIIELIETLTAQMVAEHFVSVPDLESLPDGWAQTDKWYFIQGEVVVQ